VIDGRRLGVESICTVLQVASSTYYAARNRTPSARARRDAELMPRLVALWKANYEVYGSRKLWKAARRAGIDIGRDQTARLMRRAAIQGAKRSNGSAQPDATRAPDATPTSSDASSPPANRIGCG
jgi:putative transposase